MAALANYCDTYRDFDPAQLTLLLYVQPAFAGRGVITYHKLNNGTWDAIESPDFRSSITKATLINIIKKLNVHACSVGGGRVINEDYLLGQLTDNQIYLILFDERNRAPALQIGDASARELMRTIGSPVSFMLSKVIHQYDRPPPQAPPPLGEVYIDIICSCTGGGRHLLHFMDEYATANHSSISLSSLPNVLLYYPAYGFTHRFTCDPGEADQVDARTLPIWQRRGHYSRLTIDQLYDDDEFSAYMSSLQENLYGDQTTPGCIGDRLRRLTPAQKKQSIKHNNCGNNGYRMRKCVNDQAAAAPAAALAAAAPAPCNAQKKGSSCVISGGKK